MICGICQKDDSVHYRVTNSYNPSWFFVCKRCWLDFSRTKGYKYGGTRKSKKRKKGSS